MKTKLLLPTLILLFTFAFLLLPCAAQVPQGFNYQAIARDGSGNILANQVLPVKIDIQTSLGILIYEEQFASVSSNQFGLISLVVGTGTQTGGSALSFSAIDWKAQTLYLKTQIQYPGPGWTDMGTSQIWGVPYSLVAKEVEGPLAKLGITGTTNDMEEALFEVKNKAGQTVFAVYNEGIRAYVGNGDAKGKKGGFSVGGYDATKGTTIYDLFVLSTDSARFYVDSKPNLKGARGGFSVGGYDMTKGGTPQNYLDVTPATTNIFTADTVKGFAVGNVSTGTAENYLKLNPSNYFIGHQAGINRTTGHDNAVIGYQSGASLTTGNANVLLGFQTGKALTSGTNNVIMGYQSGFKTTTGSSNVFLGYTSGYNNLGGALNIFIGEGAGHNNIDGSEDVFIGHWAGYTSQSTIRNTIIGFEAGYNLTAGYTTLLGAQAGMNLQNAPGNTFIGYHAGVTTNNGTYNVCVGMKAGGATDGPGPNLLGDHNVYLGAGAGIWHQGDNNVIIGASAGGQQSSGSTGSGNVFIGNQAGFYEMGSNKLYIDNSNTSTPLIWGDFSSRLLNFNGKVGIGTNAPLYLLDVNGAGRFSNSLQIGNSSGPITENWWEFGVDNGNGTGIDFHANSSAIDFSSRIYREGGNNGNFYIWNTGTGVLQLGPPGGSAVNISSSGNVGIGTTSPAQKLDVNGNANFSGDLSFTTGANRFINYPDVTHSLFIGGVPGTTHAPYAIHIVTEGASSIGAIALSIIGTSQNVGIGTTAPGYKLQVGSAGDGSQARANAWNLLSDVRLKTNFTEISDPLGIISSLRGFYFNWNVGTDKSRQLGLSAQDVEKVLPEIVSQGNDGYLSVEYSKLTPVLIEAIKEQQQQIESYKSENDNLKSQLQTLQGKVEQIEAMLVKSDMK